jgi:hypothetical protein
MGGHIQLLSGRMSSILRDIICTFLQGESFVSVICMVLIVE